MDHFYGAVEKSEHGPMKARAQRLFDGAEPPITQCLLKGDGR